MEAISPAWTVALVLGSTIVIVSLVLDANWMWAMVRSGTDIPPRPLFKSQVPLPSGWRHFLWIGGFVFGLVPFMMQGVMEIGRHLPPSVRLAQMIVLGPASILSIFAEHRKWKQVSNIAAIGVVLALICPYAFAGLFGLRAYAVVTGLLIAIMGILYLAFTIHRVVFGWRPRTRGVAGLRLMVDSAASLALLAAIYWPWFAPY